MKRKYYTKPGKMSPTMKKQALKIARVFCWASGGANPDEPFRATDGLTDSLRALIAGRKLGGRWYASQQRTQAQLLANAARVQSAPVASPEAPEKPVCPNCGQWQHPGRLFLDCVNDCAARNLAPQTSAPANRSSRTARVIAGLAVGLALALTAPAKASGDTSGDRGEVSCNCEGVCEMSGCDSDDCPCTLPEFGEVSPELESLWLMLGVSDWGDVDEEDLRDPFVCETLDKIEALEAQLDKGDR